MKFWNWNSILFAKFNFLAIFSNLILVLRVVMLIEQWDAVRKWRFDIGAEPAGDSKDGVNPRAFGSNRNELHFSLLRMISIRNGTVLGGFDMAQGIKSAHVKASIGQEAACHSPEEAGFYGCPGSHKSGYTQAHIKEQTFCTHAKNHPCWLARMARRWKAKSTM